VHTQKKQDRFIHLTERKVITEIFKSQD